jgi:hypothetical protein
VLVQELAAAKARIAELTGELLATVAQVRFRDARRMAKPQTKRPPLPPDEERERIIKGLKTRVRNLMSELRPAARKSWPRLRAAIRSCGTWPCKRAPTRSWS